MWMVYSAGEAIRVAIACLATRITLLLSGVLAVDMRKGCPARQPSPKKLPSDKMATTASFPLLDTAVSLTLPLSI